MASSNPLAASSNAADPATVLPLAEDQNPLGSVNMDDLLNDIYSDKADDVPVATMAVDEVWNDLVAGRQPEVTLEDFLAKAGAVAHDDVAISVTDPPPPQFHGYGVEVGVFGSEIECRERFEVGKLRAVEEPVMDKVIQQRQKRMIKNRESAARSRERKQAHTAELEALVMQLEAENARLVREEGERSRKRFKKLMENLIPVGEKQRRPLHLRAHRRVQSIG